MEILNGVFGWEDSIPNKEDKVQEGTELDCLTMSCLLILLTQPKAEV